MIRSPPDPSAPWLAPLLPFLLLAVVVGAGCGDDASGPDLGPLSELVGSWEAERMEITSKDDPSVSLDPVRDFGATFTLTIREDRSYEASMAGPQTFVETGTVEVTASTLTLRPDDPELPRSTGTWSRSGDLLTLNGETRFDFNQDHNRTPAELSLLFRMR